MAAALVVTALLVSSGFAALTQPAQYPNCNWTCSAKDVTIVDAFIDAPDTCTLGQPLSATIYATFSNGTGSNRYAIRVIGNLYVDGVLSQSFDTCVDDTMPPGTSTLALLPVSWTCGETVEARIVTVSWVSSPETCSDTPSCAARRSKCWFTPSLVIGGFPLLVDFTSASPECDGTAVSFTDQTSGGDTPYRYSWNFGDGGTSSSTNPSHLYASSGTYTVTLTVTDGRGVSGSASYTVDVNSRPTAAASNGGPYCPGDTIELFASGGTSYSWTGPNGFLSISQNPTIPSAAAADAGVYTVVVSNASGCSDQASTLVEIDVAQPTLTVPADTAVECGDSIDPVQTGQATATDDTDPSPTVTYSDVENLSGCGNTGTITRTWTATDDCGNSVSEPQTLTIVDSTPPTLEVSSTQFECDGFGNALDIAAWRASAVGTDVCSAVTVTDNYTGLSGGCPGIGSADVTFTAADACGNLSTRTETLAIVDTLSPGAGDDSATTDEDVAVLIDLLANDSDVCDPSPRLVSVAPPAAGMAEIVGSQVRYTPPAGFDGAATFSYTIEDCSGNADSALVEITVLAVNDPPVANDQGVTVQEDTPLSITATATDPDGDLLTYTILTGPSNGTISGFDPATGDLTYTPGVNYHGSDAFTFEACDPDGLCDTATVTITVEPVDDPPIADPQDLSTLEDTPLPITVTGSDADGDPISYGIVSGPSNGTITGFDPASGDLLYTPGADFTGTDSFVFEACDPNPSHGCAQATVTITVTPVNDPPIANDDATSTSEDMAVVVGVAANDSDVDGNLDPTTAAITGQPSNGTASLGPGIGGVTYTPNANFNGTDTFSYEICDADGLCDTATVSVTVIADGDPPIANDDSALTPEDQQVLIDVLDNDSDVDNDLDSTSVTITVPPVHGTVSVDPTSGDVTYTPGENFHGQDVFTYQVCDLEGVCDEAAVTVTVDPVNDPPLANDQSATAEEDTPLPITVTATDPDGGALTYSILAGPTSGTITGFDPDTGDLVYTPDTDYHGPDSFTFEVCDPLGACDTGKVTITVEPVDDPPIADPQDLTTPEDTPLPITVTASDADGDPISYGIESGPTNGTISGFDPVTGTLAYTPNERYVGPDSFTFEACDPNPLHGCAQATVTIDVTPVNDPPLAQDQSRTTSEDTETGFFSLLVSDPDNTLAEIVCDCVVPPSHGTVVRGADHTVNYIPDPNFSGQDEFRYEVCDPSGLCDTATVTVDVTPADDPPVARDDAVEVAEDGSVDIDVPANDSDPDGDLDRTSVTVLTQPAHGDVAVDLVTGEITYDPDDDFNGTDTFTYEICDVAGACDTATVTVEMNPVDDPPVAVDDTASVAEDGVVTIDVPDNDSDPDGDLVPGSVSIVSPPSSGTTTVDPVTGEIDYEPNDDFNGTDTFTYQICDSLNVCDVATVEVDVIPVDDPPVANDDSTSTPEDTAVTVDIPANDFDVDGNLDKTTVSIVSSPSNGAIAVDAITGEVTYTPEADFNGTDTFSYEICDADGLCDVADVTVNVGPEDDPPVALDDTGTVLEDGLTTIDVVDNDSDPDGNLDPTLVLVVAPPAHGDVTVDAVTGAIDYKPDPNYNGSDTFNYEICDTDGECDVATVTIDVMPVDDPPVANDDGASVAEDGSVEIDVPGNDTDPDGDLDRTSVAVLTQPAHGDVSVDLVTGEIEYEPDPNFNGTDTFTYQICDNLGVCDTAEVTVNVAPVDDLPVATPQDLTTPEDTPLAIGLIGSDADNDPLTYNILSGPSHGIISGFDPDTGDLQYTPNEDYSGPDSFTFEVCDPHPNECGTATVTIDVTPVDDPPVAVGDTATVIEDRTVTIDVPDNDSDPDGNLDPGSVSIVDPPSNGTVTVDFVTGEIDYEPVENFAGADSLDYRICDTDGLCDTATVKIVVLSVPDPPVANDDMATTTEDTPVVIPVTDNDSDPDGMIDPMTVSLVAEPTHGTVSIDPVTGVITYQPSPNYDGPDSLVYQVCNTEGICDVAEVEILVEAQNDPPEAACLETVVIDGTAIMIELQSTDPDGDDVTYSIVEGPEHGTIGGFDSVGGSFLYSSRTCVEIAIDLFVGADGPPGVTGVLPGETLEVRVSGDPALIEIIDSPSHGTAEFDTLNGTVLYTPVEGFSGADSFSYWACPSDEAFAGPVTIVYEVADSSGASDQCVVQLLVVGQAGGGAVGECEQRVIISEVAWSGTDASPDHEWIELRNMEDEPVTLEGWTLRWRLKQPEAERSELWKAIGLSGALSPREEDAGIGLVLNDVQAGSWWVSWQNSGRDDFFLIERETDNAVLFEPADLIFEEELALSRIAYLYNEGDVIELVDPSGCVVDTANYDDNQRDGWAAGGLWPSATMERTDPLEPDVDENWHTNLGLVRTGFDAWGNLLHGTPRSENSPLLGQEALSQALPSTQHPMGEPIELLFESRPEWPTDERLWHVVVTTPPLDEVQPAEWSVERTDDGDTIVRVVSNRLPITLIHVWVRTPSGDLLLAPIELYPY